MGLANISIVGNLVKAPEQIQLASGKLKTTLVVAVNHATKKNESESADFYNVVAWGRLAELAGQYLDKGQQVTATGRLTLDRWTDKNGLARVAHLWLVPIKSPFPGALSQIFQEVKQT